MDPQGTERSKFLTVAVIVIIIALFAPVIPTTYVDLEVRTLTTHRIVTGTLTRTRTSTTYSTTLYTLQVSTTFAKLSEIKVVEPGYCIYFTVDL